MRDPARIDRILELVRALWLHHQDQRFGQLVDNATFGITSSGPDLFNVEDDVLEEELQRIISHDAQF